MISVCLSTAHARLDAGAHDWPHRHAAATRTIRQTPPPAPAVQCMCPLVLHRVHRRGLQQLEVQHCYSRLSHPRLVGEGVALTDSQTHRLTLCCKPARHHLATKPAPPPPDLVAHTKRSARPNAAARRQLHFGLQLCHTVATLPAWYYTPRMHACSLLCRPLAARHRHSLDGPVVRILRGLSRAFLALLASSSSTTTSGSASRGRWRPRIMGAYPS